VYQSKAGRRRPPGVWYATVPTAWWHIGELDEKWVRVVEDICKEGDAPS